MNNRKQTFLFIALPVLLCGSVFLSLVLGTVFLNPFDGSPLAGTVLWQVRFPRIILSGLVGAMLAVSGAVLQAVLKNDLADPYILGISSGGALGAALAIVLSLPLALISSAAFLSAFAAVLTVAFISGAGGRRDPSSLILAGVAVSSFSGAVLALMIGASDKLRSVYFWMLGSFSFAGMEQIYVSAVCLFAGLFAAVRLRRQLNAFLFGEEEAKSLGVDTVSARWGLLLAASLMSGVSVAFCGVIGFVGLMVPHMVRTISGPNHQTLIPYSALGGAIFMVLADTASRCLFVPSEVPVGIITALAGAPFFIYLLVRSKRAS